MEKKMSEAKIVKALGLIGVVGVLITIISDLILLGKPSSGFSFFKLPTECMAELASWRITVGTFMGVVALPFQIAGLSSLYYGLKQSGRVIPLLVVIINAHALIMGVAFHMSYAFIGSGWKLYYEMGSGNQMACEMMKKFDFYWKILVIIMLVELLVSSTIYVWTIMSRDTLYPKWMAILNPFCILILVFLFILVLPAPVGGYIAPAFLNMTTMIFLILSTTIVYKKLKESFQ